MESVEINDNNHQDTNFQTMNFTVLSLITLSGPNKVCPCSVVYTFLRPAFPELLTQLKKLFCFNILYFIDSL